MDRRLSGFQGRSESYKEAITTFPCPELNRGHLGTRNNRTTKMDKTDEVTKAKGDMDIEILN
jgi:hypothetical protein